jgi:hypothetical protein
VLSDINCYLTQRIIYITISTIICLLPTYILKLKAFSSLK